MIKITRSTHSDGPRIFIHVAGSCLHNPGGASGWGAIIRNRSNKTITQLADGLPASEGMSNVRAEMVGIIESLKTLPDGCNITMTVNNSIIKNSVIRGYKRRKNLDLWADIDIQAARHYIKWRVARAYNKDADTMEAHTLAQKEAIKISKEKQDNA